MAPPHLLLERTCDGLRVELTAFLPDHDLKREVQQQVAKLVSQLRGLVVPERLIELQRFFDQVGAQRRARLGVVPRATRAQIADEHERAGQGNVSRHRLAGWMWR